MLSLESYHSCDRTKGKDAGAAQFAQKVSSGLRPERIGIPGEDLYDGHVGYIARDRTDIAGVEQKHLEPMFPHLSWFMRLISV
jgi:hypothetical protein